MTSETQNVNLMKNLFTFLFCFMLTYSVQAQVLLTEQFDYTAGTTLNDNGWYTHSATTNPIKVSDEGLAWSQTPYLGSGVGKAALVHNTGIDNNRPLGTYARSGSVYAGFLMRYEGVVNTGNQGYFFHMGEYADTANPVYTSVSTQFRARTFVVPGSSADKFRMGISFNSSTAPATQGVDVSRDLDTGKTYLVVVKYQFVAGDSNDQVSLYVFDDGADLSTEPSTADAGPVTGAVGDVNVMQYIALRQYSSAQRVTVDGFIVRTDWNWLPAPTPVAPMLIGPANNTKLKLDGPATTPIVINWTPAKNMSGAVTYTWQVDARAVGTFMPPALSLPSNNAGADTMLSLTYGAVDAALVTLGVKEGDTLAAVWRVRAVSGTDTLYSNSFQIDLIRKDDNPGGINNALVNSMKLYPNPSNGMVQVELVESITGTVNIQVLDAKGQVVFKRSEPASRIITLPLHELSNGFYSIQVLSDKTHYVNSLIIQK